MEKRDQTLDALKGFTIVLVMLGHCIVLNHMEEGYVYDAIKAVQMPLFILVSGYLAGMSAPIISSKALFFKIKKRAIAYLLPFFSWQLLFHWEDPIENLKTVFFALDHGLWFLMVLFIYSVLYLITDYLNFKFKTPYFFSLFFFGGYSAILILQIKMGNSFLSPNLCIYYLPFFLTSCCYSKAQTFFMQKNKNGQNIILYGRIGIKKTALCLGTLLFVYLIAEYDMIYAMNKFVWLIQIASSYLGCILLCLIFSSRTETGKMKKFFIWLGQYTLEIYVIHFRFARILNWNDAELAFYTPQGLLFIVATFLVMSVLTAICVVILKKFWVTDLLLFGKKNSKK